MTYTNTHLGLFCIPSACTYHSPTRGVQACISGGCEDGRFSAFSWVARLEGISSGDCSCRDLVTHRHLPLQPLHLPFLLPHFTATCYSGGGGTWEDNFTKEGLTYFHLNSHHYCSHKWCGRTTASPVVALTVTALCLGTCQAWEVGTELIWERGHHCHVTWEGEEYHLHYAYHTVSFVMTIGVI